MTWRRGGSQRGGHRGGRGNRANNNSSSSSSNNNGNSNNRAVARGPGGGICHFFQRTGTCRHGDSCRFSHDQGEARQARPREESPTHGSFLEFKRLLRGGNTGFGGQSHMHEQAIKLWAHAIPVLDGNDQDTQQFLAKDLISDDFMGHAYIRVTTQLGGQSDEKNVLCAYSFLKVITHPSLLDPMSVDSFVSTIYSFFAGHNGQNGIRFLLTLCRRLSACFEAHSKIPASTVSDLCPLMLKALHEMLNREARSRFNEDVTTLLDSLEVLGALAEPDTGPGTLATRVALLRRLVAREANQLVDPTAEPGVVANDTFVRSTFPLEVVIPGGRHDNDFVDMTRIQMLPTYGEINSDLSECLPSTDFSRPHFLEDPEQRHIDSAFRLLRHDIFGPVKDILKDLLAQDTAGGRYKPRVNGDARARIYFGARVQHVLVGRNGLEAIFFFDNPPQLRGKSISDRRRWWQESSRLDEGSLIAFVSSQEENKVVLFLEVTTKNTDNVKEGETKASLVSEGSGARIGVKLATQSQDTLGVLTRLHGERLPGILVEFQGLIPATFAPTLLNLQQVMKEGDLAFRRWIVPDDESNTDDAEIPPPAYARRPGFTFSLESILKGGTLSVDAPRQDTLTTLERDTSLDRGQCHALVAALMREYALVQGPPGTGKSYVGVQLVRVLLDNKAKAHLGPILIICYTNHALDQFLQHLLDVGVSKIIRIGGRSQAKELDGKNLRVVSKEVQKTRVESQILGKTYSDLEASTVRAGNALKPLHKARGFPSWATLEDFLRAENRSIHGQFKATDEEGYKVVGGDALKTWLGKKPFRLAGRIEALKNAQDLERMTRRAEQGVYLLSPEERWALAEAWLLQARDEHAGRLFEELEEARKSRQELNRIHDEVNRRTLLQADVVGVTTTGLARNIGMLRRVHPKVIICEEAAEVMEAHVLSTLMPGVEHFIQIGDHRQLRPQILNYSLSLETPTGQAWQLDRSQFERRAVGEPGMRPAPVAQLDIQRRMRPEISRLIRSVYPGLKDHESVAGLPDVVGMRHNLYWLDHDHPEESREDGARVKSHSNRWEVDIVTALVRHLVRQGVYSSSDIALLTPYTGQLKKLRAALSNDFEVFLGERDMEILALEDENENEEDGEAPSRVEEQPHRKVLQKKQLVQTLRVATVDNFQGEEAKVIIVSLVRSNRNRKVGFLRTENRINVLLSRAQHGMYLIGNAATYLHVDMWADVHAQLAHSDAVGNAFSLCCPRHPETPILCSEPADFARKSPQGGCDLPCDERLEACGHRCLARCHSRSMHEVFSCPRECPRIRATCSHRCRKLCGETCGPCQVEVRDVKLPCGHVKQKMQCYETLELSKIRCTVKVAKEVPSCLHVVEVECCKDCTSDHFSCPVGCEERLGCGHKCPGSCARCEKNGHLQCSKKCDRPYGTCDHRCAEPCHEGEECGSCKNACEVRCSHSRCAATCSKPCAPCIEQCTWSCPHRGSCNMPCAAPCDRLPCDARCEKTLACGHQCPSFCGENCPDRSLCQVCGEQGEARVDFLEDKTYKEIDLNELPVVVLTCGHFYTGESLDGHVQMGEVYAVDKTGEYAGLRGISASLAEAVPVCPDCRRPIRQFSTRRYNRVMNKAVMDETTKRFLASGQRSLQKLEEKLGKLRGDVESKGDSKDDSVRAKLFTEGMRLRRDAGFLCQKMDTEHQPAKKLHDAILTRRRADRSPSLAGQMQGLSISAGQTEAATVSALDQQVTLKARLIQMQVQELILCNKFGTGKRPETPPLDHRVIGRFLKDCTVLVEAAAKASLPRIKISAILAYSGGFQLQAWQSRGGTVDTTTPLAPPPWDLADLREQLQQALALCDGLPDSEGLRGAVADTVRLFVGTRYEEVTPEEIAAIKTAMTSGSRGLATHSGHWYNCVNGHPFAIGECGMPMELARCPECGEAVGGQNHQFVEGATRAMAME